MLRNIAYFFVLILSIFFVLCSVGYVIVVILTYDLYPSLDSEFNYAEKISWQMAIPLATLLLTSISTLSAILLGWRLDRRQAKELDLKTKDLELKIKELEIKLAASQVSNTQPQRQQFGRIYVLGEA